VRSAQQTPAGLAFLASNQRYQLADHLALLDDRLCQLAAGEIKRLMVFMPPRHGKSELCSKYFPAWFIGAYQQRVILTSYEATFAASWGRLARNVLTEWGQPVFNVRVAQDSSAADHWELEGAQGQRGVMHTSGVGGAITGKGASLLIIDDPVKNMEEAQSATMREKAWLWYTSTAFTRLEPDGRVLVIQTRWHHDDLSGRILERTGKELDDGEPWHVLSLPAIAESDESYPITDDDPYTRQEGEPLWPERFSAQRLAGIRAEAGSMVWTALYQQKPTPTAGMIWRREWFQRWRELPEISYTIQTVDSAFQTTMAADYSVIATWGLSGSRYVLIDAWRARVEFPELKRAVVDQYNKHRPSAIYIEKKASGQSAIQELNRDTNLPILEYEPKDSKIGRAQGVSPLAEAGHVYVPESAPWISDWLDEHAAFPNGAHDDYVDTSSMALQLLRDGSGVTVW
jgi:predicted phage terminase large subunit-like protein